MRMQLKLNGADLEKFDLVDVRSSRDLLTTQLGSVTMKGTADAVVVPHPVVTSVASSRYLLESAAVFFTAEIDPHRPTLAVLLSGVAKSLYPR